MRLLPPILLVFLLLPIAACATTPSNSSLDLLETAVRCPAPPVRLTEAVPPPVFGPKDSWPIWSDKLLEWGLEQAIRRAALAKWAADCGK